MGSDTIIKDGNASADSDTIKDSSASLAANKNADGPLRKQYSLSDIVDLVNENRMQELLELQKLEQGRIVQEDFVDGHGSGLSGSAHRLYYSLRESRKDRQGTLRDRSIIKLKGMQKTVV